MGLRPTQGDENGSCSATTVAGSAALPFVISTGEVMGLRPTQGDEKTGPVQQPHSMEAPPSPLSSRPELRRSVVERSAVSAVLPWECFSTERNAVEGPAVSAIFSAMFCDRAYPDFLLRAASDVHVWEQAPWQQNPSISPSRQTPASRRW